MSLSKLVLIILVVGVLVGLAEKKVRKRLKIKKRNGVVYEHVNIFHTWGERVIIILLFFVLMYNAFSTEPIIEMGHVLLIFYPVLYGFRGVMEWKYARNEKEYIMTLANLGIFFCFILVRKARFFAVKRKLSMKN